MSPVTPDHVSYQELSLSYGRHYYNGGAINKRTGVPYPSPRMLAQ